MLLTCRSLVYRLTELEEGALPAHDRLLARMHLAVCSNCRRYRDQLLAARLALSAARARATAETFAAFEARMLSRRIAAPTATNEDGGGHDAGPLS